MTSIPNNPDTWQIDGRMYPAQNDRLRTDRGRPDVVILRHRRHETVIRDNGAFEIRSRRGQDVYLSKAGADGRHAEYP